MRLAGIAAAQRLGLFDQLREHQTAATAAAALDLDELGTRWLLIALAREGLLTVDAEMYQTAGAPAAGDTPGAALLAEVLRRKRPLMPLEIVGNLDAAALTTPLPATPSSTVVAKLASAFVAGGWLVDIGCGTGAQAGAILDLAAEAKALLVDRAPVLAIAARQLARHRARIELRATDVRTFAPPPCRAALISQVLHTLELSDAASIVKRAAAALSPGGLLAIVEVAGTSAAVAWFALSLHVHGLPALLPAPMLRDWLRDAGLVDITEETLGDAVLLTGRAPAATSGVFFDDP